MADKQAVSTATTILVVVLILLLFAFRPVKSIPTGHVGVLTMFGRITGEALGEGIHLINPLKAVNVMSIQTREIKETAAVPSKEGMMMSLDTSLLFHLDPSKAAQVFQKIGGDYVDVVVEPNLRSAIRSVTAANSASALYTSARDVVSLKIFEELQGFLAPRGIVVESVLLRDIRPPETLRAAIEAKQSSEQESLRMQFVLAKERQEAERKQIEAEGIAAFQKIVTQGISEQLLAWKGIEATEKLAQSPNSKVVVIGAGKLGLPLILGGQ